jgi:hypothetical protein
MWAESGPVQASDPATSTLTHYPGRGRTIGVGTSVVQRTASHRRLRPKIGPKARCALAKEQPFAQRIGGVNEPAGGLDDHRK